MRFSILSRVFSSRKASKKSDATEKHAENSPNEDYSSVTTDDNSSTSSNTSNGSSNTNTPKSPPSRKKKYPLLSSSPSTVQLAALPVHIQFAFGMFMKRPIPENWSFLVSLLRGENMQRKLEVASSWPQAGTDSGDNEGMNRTLARLEKSLADELTVYEAEEEEEDDENLEEEKEASAVGAGAGEEIVMELLAPKVAPPPPPLARSAPTKKMKRGGRLDSDEAELDIPGSVAETFMKRPSTGNWELLVELFRNENRQNNESNILSPPRKDQPHQVLRVESDLTFDESLEAMEENEHKELSIIYESDEETDTTRNLEEETGSVDYYESDESEEEEEEEEEDLLPPPHTAQQCVLPPVVLEEVVPATEEKPPAEEPFAAGEVDWPWPDEEEEAVVPTTAVAAVPLRAAMPLREPSSPPNLPRKPTTTTIVRVSPSFANTKAKAYVLLWEKRIRRYDQSQVNVVQKSAVEPPSNVMIESTNYPNYLSNMFESRQDVAVTSCETMPPAVTTATSPAAGFIIHEEKRFVPTTNNCTPVISSTAASSSSSRSNNIVRAEVMSWENKMSNIHKDAQHVIGARGEY